MMIGFGIEILARGRRRRELQEVFTAMLDEDLEGRILTFDQKSALAAAGIAAARRQVGRLVEIRDTQIAGIAAAPAATLATGNICHFEGAGIALVDPWPL